VFEICRCLTGERTGTNLHLLDSRPVSFAECQGSRLSLAHVNEGSELRFDEHDFYITELEGDGLLI
jgi:hypothetical protein